MSAYLATSPQVLALLRSAKECPDDDTPRLVLADWLEEHCDPDRAEFIRLQLRLAPGANLDGQDRKALERRTQALLDRHGGAWLGSLWRFWLSPASWHRGLLTVGLSRQIDPESIADALPWLDTVLFQVSARQCLQHVSRVLARTCLNHVCLDLRLQQRESRLLDLLARLPEETCFRTLSWDWPLGMLNRQDQPRTTPAASDGFLERLLGELPATRHLTHLASSPPWTVGQADLIRSFGIVPVHADQKPWMHARSAGSFRDRKAALSGPDTSG